MHRVPLAPSIRWGEPMAGEDPPMAAALRRTVGVERTSSASADRARALRPAASGLLYVEMIVKGVRDVELLSRWKRCATLAHQLCK